MDNLLLYLVKVSAGTTLFYLCYLLFFRKDTFYLRNRIFLILTLLLPVVIPALRIPVHSDAVVTAEPVPAIVNYIDPAAVTEIITAAPTPFDYSRILLLIYFTVTGILLLKGAISLLSTYRIIKNGDLRSSSFPRVVVTDNRVPPFSFFPYAVIPAEDYNNKDSFNIIEHEFAHIRQGHTFDLLLSEVFIAFQWFNPFIWLIKRSVILNHEYLADHVSLLNNINVREYQYRMLNFNPRLKNVSLAHNFNSLIKNRIIMINRKPTRKYAALKNILILPVALFGAYAFATPEYRYSDAVPGDNTISVNQPAIILQKEVNGIINKEDGNPLKGVYIMSTGTAGNISTTYSGTDGKFKISIATDEPYLLLSATGYKSQSVKADISSEMVIRMIKDPGAEKLLNNLESPPKQLILLDGVITEETPPMLMQKLGSEFATMISLNGDEATSKYGEKGKNGATEVYSRKKATELGIKFPYRRFSPDEFPTFQGKSFRTFKDWVISQIKYPAEATDRGIKGRFTAGYTIEADGSVTNVKVIGNPDPVLADAVIKAIYSSPKWEPALKPEARVPFIDGMDLKFELPDRVMKDEVFVVVEKMPMYTGGDVELLRYIAANAKYPAGAKEAKAEGRVIVRFMVSTQGNAEEVSILKGVHPLLDEEAVRVVSTLTGFEPGMQGGKPVNVWYMVPVNFALSKPASDPVEPISIRSEDGKKPLIVVDSVITDIDVNSIDSKSRGEYSLPFSIIRRDGTVSTEVSKSEDQGNEIIIKYYEGTNLLLSKYETYGSSGKLFKMGNKIGFENVFFPFNLKITKSNFGTNTLSRPDINFECMINEPGKWEVTIRTSAEKFPMLQRDEERTRVN